MGGALFHCPNWLATFTAESKFVIREWRRLEQRAPSVLHAQVHFLTTWDLLLVAICWWSGRWAVTKLRQHLQFKCISSIFTSPHQQHVSYLYQLLNVQIQTRKLVSLQIPTSHCWPCKKQPNFNEEYKYVTRFYLETTFKLNMLHREGKLLCVKTQCAFQCYIHSSFCTGLNLFTIIRLHANARI